MNYRILKTKHKKTHEKEDVKIEVVGANYHAEIRRTQAMHHSTLVRPKAKAVRLLVG